ncbi:acyl carrier protein [Streptomyces sp. NBC_00257]|uniref:acyl carrier protein n=1 Tax=Streptomyces TaxID=1883 RepID=UPI000F5BA482|nr:MULTISPECIES: acyl carrier protein [unclassified Streptomyces]WSG56405.1 acyl carrier protein [Streptomyces sp. NBC_01732]WSW10978.1 acyl carrier protein [Streptomyces sp. NBC_01005]WSX07571.1 acyl carrier protein [Streptomyces sp. NBC_00987]WTB60860.1 acyl carrier protein [Streptomyces sp. NBC_00826]WTD00484.1 acyl carrier protein [Streptomyces sp. NBC_01650]WTH96001.1 acyl carrier protein [Streptomyces sp. NBC_00825]WTI04975.1 acyl carrier protein [Streptomyces sp. NBC_00822]
MSAELFTLADLKQILLEAAGVEEGIDFDGDVLDTEFEALGYESLALLETGGRIERAYGIDLDDDVLTNAVTPRALIGIVNELLTVSRTA